MTNQTNDILLEHVLSNTDDEARWREFQRAADGDAALWRQLAEAQRDQVLLEQAVAAEVSVADTVELPVAPAHDVQDDRGDDRGPVIARIGAWSGWVVAAMVALAWTIAWQTGATSGSQPHPGPRLVEAQPQSSPADVQLVSDSPDQLLQEYLRLGKEQDVVLSELPTKTLIDSRRLPEGGIEVLYIRHILERGSVQTLLQFDTPDEHGNAPVVPYKPVGQGDV